MSYQEGPEFASTIRVEFGSWVLRLPSTVQRHAISGKLVILLPIGVDVSVNDCLSVSVVL